MAGKRKNPVYPRWRGEHGLTLGIESLDRGLSPLARGTLLSLVFPLRVLRFIPAGAGNTVRRQLKMRYVSVYPRWRGEHPYSENLRELARGLSPLARGTQRHVE